MHDIWNPWHGCKKCSEGCRNCYMYYLDSFRGRDGGKIYRTGAGFDYPLSKTRDGKNKIKSGETLRVCMTSDFFLEEADEWRKEAWRIISMRPDVMFFLLTKRPQRVEKCLPSGWGDGWDNVFFNVTAENQKRADERVPLLLSLPFKHKGVMCAPFIGPVSLKKYLKSGLIERVLCDGENYGGARPTRYEWVEALSEECKEAGVTFVFCSTGRRFYKGGRLYEIEDTSVQAEQAYLSGLSHEGRKILFEPKDNFGLPIPKSELYVPYFGKKCDKCAMKIACNGCGKCGKCDGKNVSEYEQN